MTPVARTAVLTGLACLDRLAATGALDDAQLDALRRELADPTALALALLPPLLDLPVVHS